MNNEKVINQATNFFESFTLDQASKIDEYQIEPGDQILVYWSGEYGRPDPDKGYAIALPGTSFHEDGNIVVHFPKLYGDKGEPDAHYIHLVYLCNAKDLDGIEVVKLN